LFGLLGRHRRRSRAWGGGPELPRGVMALVVGLCACGLAYLANHSLPADALVGGGAAGGALTLFHTVIGR
jgi:hypothetical protein